MQAETPTISSTTEGGVQRSTAIATSNGIGAYYANPQFQGRAGAQTGGLTAINPAGGFGVALYGTTGVGSASGAGGIGGASGTAANRTGAATTSTLGRTGTTGALGATALGGATGGLGRTTTGGFGGTTGFGTTGRTAGGFGGTQQNTQNQALSTGRAVAYTQTIRFPAPAMQTPQLTSELQTMLASSPSLTAAAGLQVAAGDGGAVVIRGTVSDADEARLVEGMVRLTPGVKSVKNELTIK
jgi:hypothetical protein